MNCLKSSNILANTLLFPGSVVPTSYDHRNFAHEHPEAHAIYIPTSSGSYIPAILVLAERNIGSMQLIWAKFLSMPFVKAITLILTI
jgi:hypothetical protein